MEANEKKFVRYYPAFLNLKNRRCVVVGGGGVALRKVRSLLECGAEVTVISPQALPAFSRMAEKRAIRRVRRNYRTGDLEGAAVVIAATDEGEVNHSVADEARRVGALLDVVDDPGCSDFIVPSFFRRGELSVAISTAGMSPALARKIRTRLEKTFGKEYASLLSVLAEVRSSLKRQGRVVSAASWQRALDLDLLIGLLRKNQRSEAKASLLEKLKGKG